MNEQFVRDLSAAYADSVAYYKGNLIYITNIIYGGRGNVYMHYSPLDTIAKSWDSEEKEKISLESLKLDFPRLGYTNYFTSENKYAVLLKRMPRRQFKKGACTSNFMARAAMHEDLTYLGLQTIGRESILNSKFLLSFSPIPDYPTLSAAYSLLNRGEAFSCAFSTNYALSLSVACPKILLLYKNYIIGYCNTDILYLLTNFILLREELEEFGVVKIFKDIIDFQEI